VQNVIEGFVTTFGNMEDKYYRIGIQTIDNTHGDPDFREYRKKLHEILISKENSTGCPEDVSFSITFHYESNSTNMINEVNPIHTYKIEIMETDEKWKTQIRGFGEAGDSRAVIPALLEASAPYIGVDTGLEVALGHIQL